MKCSDCGKNLKQVNFRGILVDECPKCHGRWFARGELNKAKDNTDEDLTWLDFDPFGKDVDKFSFEQEERRCPKCDKNMASIKYEKSGVNIEKCLECQGVWLQYGEFKKMISYLQELIVTESASEYVKDSIQKFLDVASGKENVKSELKDFLVVLKLLKQRFAIEHPKIANITDKIYQYLPFL